jgi:hypothetical protein
VNEHAETGVLEPGEIAMRVLCHCNNLSYMVVIEFLSRDYGNIQESSNFVKPFLKKIWDPQKEDPRLRR